MSGEGADASGGGEGGNGTIVIDEPFAPAAAWALETDDSFVLSKLGCLEMLVSSAGNGVLEPMLATSWDQTAPTVWEFGLRSGVTFQNGEPMDAEAVAGALQHALGATAPASVFSPDVVENVEAVGDDTVRITTPTPDYLMPERMSTPHTGILAPSAFEGSTPDPQGTCTGPFAIIEEVPQQSVSLEANSSYWGGGVGLDAAEVRFIPDGAMRATQIDTGEAQIARKLPVTSMETLSGSGGTRLETVELPRTTELILNNGRAPFDDELVRRAVQAAVDTRAISEAVYPGAAHPAVGPFTPTEPFAPEQAEPVEADPDAAAELLAEAGVDPSSLNLTLLAYTEGTGFADLAAVLQEQLGAVGIDVTIETGDYASMEPALLEGDFDMALLSRNYLNDMPDPLGFLTADYTCDGSYNITHVCDPELDALVEEARVAESRDERYAVYAQTAELLQSQAVNVFLVHETETAAVAGVVGYAVHPYYTLTADLARATG
ncbi:ABC transporter substrate-binding protein [Streptomyces sp. NBC_01803]|uniref:ABC transporter substrate-binding protein n=1 Tax=Streptomyces sp. NBC_01803 TaxID=2975946 RepID=UPI002DD9EF6F|nr:ABC transporter substrate-binding protein [Streptomyces sp. NBC_01803]WSA43372.1 ABC transporter substrate-binding protein [Streptomyces sp. NBC_01803]